MRKTDQVVSLADRGNESRSIRVCGRNSTYRTTTDERGSSLSSAACRRPFSIQARHIVVDVPHNGVDSNLVTSLACDRLERGSQCGEADTGAFDLQSVQQCVERIANLIDVALS